MDYVTPFQIVKSKTCQLSGEHLLLWQYIPIRFQADMVHYFKHLADLK